MEKTTQINAKGRLYSLDALRGFDMLWIIGGGAFIAELSKVLDWGWIAVLARQMEHVPWEGFHFFDLIFPLFMFISGVAIPFALTSRLEKGVAKSDLVRKITKRMVLLVLFGLLYNGVLQNGFATMRAASVLAQIGIAYFFASLIVIYTATLKARVLWLIGILISIAMVQFLVPVPGFGAGVFTPEGSVNAWIDQHFLPGKLIYGAYDPEGVLCIVSAISVTLMGSFAGYILREKNSSSPDKIKKLLVSGIALIIIALALSPVYPIIKNIWTVPFNLLTAGISFLLLLVFYFIIDVKGYRRWTFFFRVIGLNSITIYLGGRIIDFWHSSRFILGWLEAPLGDAAQLMIIVGVIALEWLLLYYLYKNKIFLRV